MEIITVNIEDVFLDPFLEEIYGSDPNDFLDESIKRTGNKSIYPLVGNRIPNSEKIKINSGGSRLRTMIQLGQTEVDVIIREITNETHNRFEIIDGNKQRIKSGRVKLKELRFWCEIHTDQRGKPGSRYSKIGKEIGRSKDRTKDHIMLDNFFHGEGDVVLEWILENKLSVSQGFQLKKVVEKYPEKFTSEDSFKKLLDKSFDYKRLDYSLLHLDLNDDIDFDLIKLYLQKDLTTDEFTKMLEKLGKVEQRKDNHRNNKVSVPEIDENYISDHVHLIHGDNRTVEFTNPFGRPINCFLGSPYYGNLRLNGTDPKTESGHNMSGQEYGIQLSETYERYKEFMSPDGSIYVIIDDFRNDKGVLSCGYEHFVVEMERKGFYLVGRYVWWKKNPQPRSHQSKNMVNGFEMIYRFVLDPNNYYSNPDLFIELDQKEVEFREGCTNTDNRGKTTRGKIYLQPNLKKPRNTFDEDTCKQIVLDNIQDLDYNFRMNIDVIRGNVQRPEDYFRDENEKRHTSTAPQYLTKTLILESTKPGDLVVDIWNGVGGTMESSLLLQRDYIGIEKEVNYFKQSQRRLQILESDMEEFRIGNDLPQLGMVG